MNVPTHFTFAPPLYFASAPTRFVINWKKPSDVEGGLYSGILAFLPCVFIVANLKNVYVFVHPISINLRVI